jgi:hypothetical protein
VTEGGFGWAGAGVVGAAGCCRSVSACEGGSGLCVGSVKWPGWVAGRASLVRVVWRSGE